MIHLLPTFHGFTSKDPHKNLKEFYIVCSTMKPQGVTREQSKLRAFPFLLVKGKRLAFYLPSRYIATGNDMKRKFLEKFFLASRAITIQKDINGIHHNNNETLYEYWEHFD